MIRTKNSLPTQPHSANWAVTDSWADGRRKLTPGKEFRVTGHRGRWLFLRHVTVVAGKYAGDEWVDCTDPRGRLRSIPAAKVGTIHRTTRRRGNTGE